MCLSHLQELISDVLLANFFLDYARHIIHTQVTHIITERMVLVSGFVAKLPKSAFETISQCFQ